jgi:hypothetical protein
MTNIQNSTIITPSEAEAKRKELISVLANIIKNYVILQSSK